LIPADVQGAAIEGPRGFDVSARARGVSADAQMWAGLVAEVAGLVGLSDDSTDELRDEVTMMLNAPFVAPLLDEGRQRPAVLAIATGAKWVLRFMRERRQRNDIPADLPEKDAESEAPSAEVK
jgi:hypothetical protein